MADDIAFNSAASAQPVVVDAYTAQLGALVKEMLAARSGAGQRITPEGALEIDIPRASPQPELDREMVAGEGAYGLPRVQVPSPMRPEDTGAQDALDVVRQVSGRQRMEKAGFNPDSQVRDELGEFLANALPEAAMTVAGPAGGAFMRAAPKIAGATIGGAAGLFAANPAGAQQKKKAPAKAAGDPLIMDEQRQLARDGFYQGAIDGIDKGETQLARAAAAKAREERRKGDENLLLQQGRDRAASETAAAAKADAEARAAAAKTKQMEEERIAREAETVERNRSELDRKLQAKRDSRPWYDIREELGAAAGPAGMILGMFAGGTSGAKVTKRFEQFAADRAETGNKLLDLARKPGRHLDAQIGDINQFAGRKVGGSSEQPYLHDPATAKWSANPKQPAGGDLFRPTPASVGRETAAHGLAMSLYGGESAWASHYLDGAQKELEAARLAAQKDPSDVNIDRMMKAERNVEMYTGLQNFGRVGAASHAITGLGKTAMTDRKVGKVNVYDAWRAKLNRELLPQPKPQPSPPGGAPSPAPAPAGIGAPPPSPAGGATQATATAPRTPAPAAPAAPATATPAAPPTTATRSPPAPAAATAAPTPKTGAGASGSAWKSPNTGEHKLPKGFTMAGLESNPLQTRVGGQFGPNADKIREWRQAQKAKTAPSKQTPSTASKVPAKGKQSVNPAPKKPAPEPEIDKQSTQMDDTRPMGRGASMRGRDALLNLWG